MHLKNKIKSDGPFYVLEDSQYVIYWPLHVELFWLKHAFPYTSYIW